MAVLSALPENPEGNACRTSQHYQHGMISHETGRVVKDIRVALENTPRDGSRGQKTVNQSRCL